MYFMEMISGVGIPNCGNNDVEKKKINLSVLLYSEKHCFLNLKNKYLKCRLPSSLKIDFFLLNFEPFLLCRIKYRYYLENQAFGFMGLG